MRAPFGLLLFLCLFQASRLSAQETENQFWPETKIFVTLSGKTRLYFDYAATRTESLSSYSDGQLGASLDFYVWRLFRSRAERHLDASRSKTLMIRAGYFLDRTPANSEDPYVAHVPSIEIHPRFELPGKVLVTDRNRFDLRIVDGIYKPRYRNRLKFERTFKLGKMQLTPYADVEFFTPGSTTGFSAPASKRGRSGRSPGISSSRATMRGSAKPTLRRATSTPWALSRSSTSAIAE